MTPEKLSEAEKKAQSLLDELNEVERSLSTLSPADPQRVVLKQRKENILPRYRGAKENVKNLRRILSATGAIGTTKSLAPSPVPTKQQDLLMRLYETLSQVVDRFHEGESPIVHAEDLPVIEEFLDHMEP